LQNNILQSSYEQNALYQKFASLESIYNEILQFEDNISKVNINYGRSICKLFGIDQEFISDDESNVICNEDHNETLETKQEVKSEF